MAGQEGPTGPEPSAAAVNTYDDLLSNFLNINAKSVDLLHDMGSQEAAWVCGDGLLLEALLSPRASAGTPISCIYQVEQLLSQLRRSSSTGTAFSVFFVGDSLYSRAWRQLLPMAEPMRAILRSHLAAAGEVKGDWPSACPHGLHLGRPTDGPFCALPQVSLCLTLTPGGPKTSRHRSSSALQAAQIPHGKALLQPWPR